MYNEIKIFESAEFGAVRTMTDEQGVPWFVGKDVAEILGYKNSPKAIRDHVAEEDKTVNESFTVNGSTPILINESGLYSLILSSKMPKAREFKHWVTSVVLPQIRKTGGYIPVAEEDDEKAILAKALLISQRTIELKNEQLEMQRPLVEFATALKGCVNSIKIRDLAKLLTQNGYKIGQGRMFYWLRLHKYIFQQETRPIQKWVERGIFELRAHVYDDNVGRKLETLTTMVTPKGQQYFIDGFLYGKFDAYNF